MFDRPLLRTAGASLLGAVVLVCLLEGALALALETAPGTLHEAFETARRDWYMDHERHILQFEADCAEHDPELGYRMKPGECRFRNREYDTRLEINSLGVRDSEAALEAPRILVTGDSFAIGWGVEQDETLADRLQELTGEKTLNLAVSSYGTARELIGLRRADLSAAHTLVIQYCENDYFENRQFQLGRGSLPVMNAAAYEQTVRAHEADRRHFPGRYVLRFFPLWWRGAAPEPPPRECALDADAFLDALAVASPPALPAGRRLRLLVFEGLYDLERPACFVSEVERRALHSGLPDWVSELVAIDSSALLDATDYYVLDDHLRASGHAKIAAAIAARLPGGPGLAE